MTFQDIYCEENASEAKALLIQSPLCDNASATTLWQHGHGDGVEWLALIARELVEDIDESEQPRLHASAYALMRMAEQRCEADESDEWLAIVRNELA